MHKGIRNLDLNTADYIGFDEKRKRFQNYLKLFQYGFDTIVPQLGSFYKQKMSESRYLDLPVNGIGYIADKKSIFKTVKHMKYFLNMVNLILIAYDISKDAYYNSYNYILKGHIIGQMGNVAKEQRFEKSE